MMSAVSNVVSEIGTQASYLGGAVGAVALAAIVLGLIAFGIRLVWKHFKGIAGR